MSTSFITITSVSNPRVKQWAQLQDRKFRNREGRYIAEGIHLVQEALRSGAPVESVVFDQERGLPAELTSYLKETGTEASVSASAEPIEWIAVTDAVIRKCTDAETPQSVFAVMRKPELNWRQLFEAKQALVVVVDGVQDPGNLGTIIRSADAVGATGVLIGRGTVDVYNSKTVRSTMGSMFHLPVVEGDLLELLPEAKQQGVCVVSTSLQAEHSCYSFDFRQPTWFVVGNEGKGVSPHVQSLVDESVIIPMQGKAESLNVAMATTVLLYEAMRQRHYR
ncbi:TrmH family RNA methyltransferase [Paenibacillus assamensis]|uniref:TrmH family RNA methyltransferase n=1 Tax=Paenibacillus assamensis TaxID=311244 RepID=UPI001FE1FC24|nr:RNA methyltransferase [Paenibacillus assamensis]